MLNQYSDVILSAKTSQITGKLFALQMLMTTTKILCIMCSLYEGNWTISYQDSTGFPVVFVYFNDMMYIPNKYYFCSCNDTLAF